MDKEWIWGFLMSLVVKRLTAQAAAVKGGLLPSMTIWLQSQPIVETANKFYKSLGFVKVNMTSNKITAKASCHHVCQTKVVLLHLLMSRNAQ